MSPEMFTRYLETRYTEQLDYYEAKAAKCKRRYHILQGFTIVCSAILPVLVNMPLQGSWKWVPTSVSLLLAVSTSLFKVLHLPEVWISFRSAAEKLKREKVEFDFRLGAYENQTDEQINQIFIQKVEAVLGEEAGAWSSALAKSPNSSAGNQGNDAGGQGGGQGSPRKERPPK